MKNIKYLIFIVLLFPLLVSASNSYEITSCDVELTLDDENNYTYDESVNFKFNAVNVLATKELPASISNLEVDKDYFLETSDTKIIKIYSNDYTNRLYNIKYTLKNDSSNKNIYKMPLCHNYNGRVNNVNFHINLSDSISKNNVTFYLNGKIIDDVDFKVSDTKIEGSYHTVKEDDILTVEVNYGTLYYDTYTIMCIVVPITFVILSCLLWYFYGRDLKFKVSRLSKLPSSINLLDMALVNDGVVTSEEAYYLLLDLANRGYLKIVEHKNNNFSIIRGKEYDGKDYIEASFIKALFRKNIRVSISEYIEAVAEGKDNHIKEMVKEIPNADITNNFKRACNNILGLINTNEEKNKYFEPTSDNKKYYLIGMVAIILVLVTSLPFIEINRLYLLPISVLFSVVTLYLLLNFVEKTDLHNREIKIELFILLSILIMIIMLLPAFKYNRLYIIAFGISIICVAIILFFYKYMPKRTVYGSKVYSKIEGYKNFLLDLRDEDLATLLENNPNYLYDVLASSYILNCSDLIIKKIKDHNVKEPSWYTLEEGFTPIKFNNSILRLKKKLKNENEEN